MSEETPDVTYEQEGFGVDPAPPVRPVPDGDYTCRVDDIRKYKSKSSNAEGHEAAFIIAAGEFAGVMLPPFRFYHLGDKITDKMKQRSAQDAGYLGFKNFKQEPPKVDPNKLFLVSVVRDEESPLGKIFCFNPLP